MEVFFMSASNYSSKEKFNIVLEGISGKIEIVKLCTKYNISQSQFYRWKENFFKFGYQAFEQKIISKKEQILENQVSKLKNIIAEQTIELKKND
jgi:transposase